MALIKTDICIIGAGPGGLCVASVASQMGVDVTLLEKHEMGGDCLNYGCVPSKALIAAGRVAQHVRDAHHIGVDAAINGINMPHVHAHIHDTIGRIAPHDSQERFEELGCHVIREKGYFISRNQVQAGDTIIQFKYCIIATGASAFAPPIEGLADTPYDTNETIFNINNNIESIGVIGGGVIGLELAQAYHRLGITTTVYSRSEILRGEEPDIRERACQALKHDGVNILEYYVPNKVSHDGKKFTLYFDDGATHHVEKLLIAVGRKVHLDIGLDAAGVVHNNSYIETDARLRTKNKRIFAIGDARGGEQFTHKAAHDAGIIIRNILFKMPAKARPDSLIPKVLFIAPEIANLGMGEVDAISMYGHDNIRILSHDYDNNDKAQCEGNIQGYIKVICHKSGKILGVHILGEHAGELLNPWCLAMDSKLKIGAIASYLVAYPTLSELSKQVAGKFYTPKLYNETMRKFVRFIMALG